MNRSRYVQLGVVLAPAVADRVRQQIRERACREQRSLTFSKVVREALTNYGIDLTEPDASVQAAPAKESSST